MYYIIYKAAYISICHVCCNITMQGSRSQIYAAVTFPSCFENQLDDSYALAETCSWRLLKINSCISTEYSVGPILILHYKLLREISFSHGRTYYLLLGCDTV